MTKEVSEINWRHIMNKFSTYDGVINYFCEENNIKPAITNTHAQGAKGRRIERYLDNLANR